MNFFLFLSIAFLAVFALGMLFERARIPWLFSALFLGALLSVYNPYIEITDSEVFNFLAELGMYFLLFMIGLELNISEIANKKEFIFKSTFFIIFFEALFGCLLIHFVFGYSFLMSILVSLSFATVGEAILIPILKEFKLINRPLGQAIISIGIIDDLVEVFLMFVMIFLIDSSSHESILILIIIGVLLVLTIWFRHINPKGNKFKFKDMESLYFFLIAIFLLFIGLGNIAEVAPIAALLAGIALRTFIPETRLKLIESEIQAMSYGFFVPIFFLWVGASMDLSVLLSEPLLIILIVLVSSGAKIVASYLVANKELGVKQSIVMGVGLSVRFSTSIVIIKLMYDHALIDLDLYTVIIASSILFQFIVPLLFAKLITVWKLDKKMLLKHS